MKLVTTRRTSSHLTLAPTKPSAQQQISETLTTKERVIPATAASSKSCCLGFHCNRAPTPLQHALLPAPFSQPRLFAWWWLPQKLAAATLVGHSCHFFCQLNCSLLCCVVLLQHDCNITATRTATQPRNAVFYHTICVFDLAKARSLSKRFKTFKHGAGEVYPVNYSVAWQCCSSYCSYVAVVLQFKSTQHSTWQPPST